VSLITPNVAVPSELPGIPPGKTPPLGVSNRADDVGHGNLCPQR